MLMENVLFLANGNFASQIENALNETQAKFDRMSNETMEMLNNMTKRVSDIESKVDALMQQVCLCLISTPACTHCPNDAGKSNA